MKAKIFKVTGLSLIAASALLITGCTADFEEANRPGDKTSSEELGRDNYSTGSFLVQMQNEAFPEQENTYQMNQDLIGNYLGRYFTYANTLEISLSCFCFSISYNLVLSILIALSLFWN